VRFVERKTAQKPRERLCCASLDRGVSPLRGSLSDFLTLLRGSLTVGKLAF
jgi:hypothetical protein